jgi:hypothetical protein|nr:MAG TPA: hypothetical protein [Caudoviricetes sp.]
MCITNLKKNMADDNRSLFDILEDIKALEEDFLIEAEKFKKEYQSKKLNFDFLNSIIS